MSKIKHTVLVITAILAATTFSFAQSFTISPNDTLSGLDEKVEDYLAAGVRLICVVNPKKRTVTVHQPNSESQTLSENDTLDGLDVVSGFQYTVARLFAGKR